MADGASACYSAEGTVNVKTILSPINTTMKTTQLASIAHLIQGNKVKIKSVLVIQVLKDMRPVE